jgi:hypothetical protein
MFARSFLLISLALALTTGCSKDDSRPSATATQKPGTPAGGATGASATATTSTGHAPAGVKPGSHEDWCAEHEVPESQCTRCNPDLIPAFKATNDWCAEHGLPESQCKICNPGIEIKRPPRGS